MSNEQHAGSQDGKSRYDKDEEQQALYLREAVVRRRQIIEQQIAIYGPLNMPPHLQIELEYQDEELARLDKRLTNARRRKKREEAMQQVVSAAGGFKQLLLPTLQPSRRRKKGFITQIQIWLTRIGLIVVLCVIRGVEAHRAKVPVILRWQSSRPMHDTS